MSKVRLLERLSNFPVPHTEYKLILNLEFSLAVPSLYSFYIPLLIQGTIPIPTPKRCKRLFPFIKVI